MIFHPAVIALLVSSGICALLLFGAVLLGLRILRRWDIRSGSELQLALERRTYLASTLLVYVFAFQLLSLFLFVYTADRIHPLFVGAMCAAGSLNANAFGYPALLAKMAGFLAAGMWLILNHADSRAYDYPLTRTKYLMLLAVAPLFWGEAALTSLYFLKLDPDLILSCCGSLFSEEGKGLAPDLAALPPLPAGGALLAALGVTIGSGALFRSRGRGGLLFALSGTATFPVALAALISFIAPFIYSLPTHHCPFDLLQREYRFVGYPLYLALFGGTVAALGVGVLLPFRERPSLAGIVPSIQKRLALVAIVSLLLFAALALWGVLASDLVLFSPPD